MFTKKAIGLDIADHTIEAVELEQSLFSSVPSIVSSSRLSLEKGIVEHGRIVNRKQLLDALAILWDHSAPKQFSAHDIIVGIPERQVYTSVVTIEMQKGDSLSDLVRDIASTTIPLEKDDLTYAYSVISKKEHTSTILLYGISREVLEEWSDFFAGSPYQPLAFDHELLAIIRGLFNRAVHQPVCIVDCGAERTKIAVYSAEGLQYVHALEIAGDAFTDALAKSLDVSKEEAEKVKKEEGLTLPPHRVLFETILEPLLTETSAACGYYEKNFGNKVTEIILVGGSARLKGLPEYMAEKTGYSVRKGSSFLAQRGATPQDDQLHYIEAIGLALKGIQSRIWEVEHPSFSLE